MKTRRVIQKLKVKDGEFFYEGIGYGSMGVEREKFPDGTEAELAVYEDVPSKRELVVPEGMKWDENALWFYGLPVAFIYEENSGWYRVPHQMVSRQVCFDNIEEGREVIENALSEHNYFGVRKVVDNE